MRIKKGREKWTLLKKKKKKKSESKQATIKI